MFGTGLPELLVIGIIALLLFGPALISFWLGYVVGRSKSADDAPSSSATDAPDDTNPNDSDDRSDDE